ncbi:DUF3298 and DUF4163 domain-containing protein [Candidatus Gracilibacteria bacterium]|nr:DUF3298 and DUF4163 domain-containing protein [Candidatus Gracilibacteria bacterium]
MRKFVLAFGFGLLLVGCSVSNPTNKLSSASNEDMQQVEMPEGNVSEETLPDGVTEEKVSDKTDAYWVSLTYPQWKDEKYNVLNTAIATLIDTEFNGFVEQEFFLDESSAAYGQYHLANVYEITAYTPNMISVRFDFATYTGGAHGMQYSRSVNYALPIDKIIEIGLMEEALPGFLNMASNFCSVQITQDLGEFSDKAMIADGLAPNVQNFATFTYVGDEALEFTFDPYQVAPYAAGPQVCYIELEEFRKAREAQAQNAEQNTTETSVPMEEDVTE